MNSFYRGKISGGEVTRMFHGGGEMKNKTIRVNGEDYTFLVKRDISAETGLPVYAILRNQPDKNGYRPCLKGEVEEDNPSYFYIFNISKNRHCGIPYIDKKLTKRMIELIAKLLRENEDGVKWIRLYDNAGIQREDGNNIFISDMNALRGRMPFYVELGFEASDRVVNNDIIRNMDIAGKSDGFILEDFIHFMEGDNGINMKEYCMRKPIELPSRGISIKRAMTYLLNEHYDLLYPYINRIMLKYKLISVVEKCFIRAV